VQHGGCMRSGPGPHQLLQSRAGAASPDNPPAHLAVKGAARCHSSKHHTNQISRGNAGCRDARAAERVLQGMAGSPSGLVSCTAAASLQGDSKQAVPCKEQGAHGCRATLASRPARTRAGRARSPPPRAAGAQRSALQRSATAPLTHKVPCSSWWKRGRCTLLKQMCAAPGDGRGRGDATHRS